MAPHRNSNNDYEIVRKILGATEGTFRNNIYSKRFEDERYKANVSDGNSSLSFGLTQLDVGGNNDARSLFKELLGDALIAGRITPSEATEFYKRAQIKGLKDKSKKYPSKFKNFTTAELEKINRSVFSTPEARRKIDKGDSKQITLVADRTTKLVNAVRKAWGTAGVFEATDSHNQKAIGHVISWINRTKEPPNEMTNFLTGNPEDVFAGPDMLISGPPTLNDVKDYLMHSKQFVNKSRQFNFVDQNIDLGINELRPKLGRHWVYGRRSNTRRTSTTHPEMWR